jgi:LysR family transcriptional activator of mexEF-oprN operon
MQIFNELGPAMDVIRGDQPRQGVRPGQQLQRVPPGPVGRCRVRPVPGLAEALREGGAADQRGGAPGQFPADAGPAGLGRDFGGVSYTTDLPANAKRRKLRDIGVRVLRADDRPGPLTLDEYCARPHVMVSFPAT